MRGTRMRWSWFAIPIATLMASHTSAQPTRQNPSESRAQLVLRSTSLNLEGIQFYQKGQYALAADRLRQAVAIREKLYPKEQYPNGELALATSLNAFAAALHAMGRHDEAIDHALRAKPMYEALFPNGHALLATNINLIGTILHARGDLEEAAVHLHRALRMRQTIFPKGNAAIAASLTNCGAVFEALADLHRAFDCYNRALELHKSLYPQDRFPDGHSDLSAGFNNLGLLLHRQGEHALARTNLERALQIDKALYPPTKFPNGHPNLAGVLNNLGAICESLGEFDAAFAYSKQALGIKEKLYPIATYPTGHAELAISLQNVGAVQLARNNYDQAIQFAERALDMQRKLHPPDKNPKGHLSVAASLHNLSLTFAAGRQIEKAATFAREAVASLDALMPSERFPAGHPLLANCLLNAGRLAFDGGDLKLAIANVARALAMQTRLVELFAEGAAETQALNFSASLPTVRDAWLSIAVQSDLSAAETYTAIWSSKHAVTRVLERRQRTVPAESNPDRSQLLHDLLRTRRRLAAALLRATGDAAGDASSETIESLSAHKEKLERLLANARPDAAVDRLLLRSQPADLVHVLPTGVVFIDFVRYMRLTPRTARRSTDPGPMVPYPEQLAAHYVAFLVVGSGRDKSFDITSRVLRIDLGPAEPIDQAIHRWRMHATRAANTPFATTDPTAASASQQDAPAAGIELRQRVWEPVERAFPRDTHTVLVAPDGHLSRMAWPALPGRKPNSYLIEELAIASVPHGPWLVGALRARLQIAGNASTGAPRTGGKGDVTESGQMADRMEKHQTVKQQSHSVLLVGDVAYDGAPSVAAAADQLAYVRAPERSGEPVSWPSLPGTAAEIDAIASLAGGRTVHRLTGNRAATTSIAAMLAQVGHVHLATHGFFADAKFRSALGLDERIFTQGDRGERATAGARNPLVLSGLVLAGANRQLSSGKDSSGALPAPAFDDNGVMTAESIVSLPLDQLDLVVLSACETGLGELAGGEGVLGLQRAFHLAGARTTIASLWKVDDAATRALMVAFYTNLWKKKLSKLESLRQAQLAILNRYDPKTGLLRGLAIEPNNAADLRSQASGHKPLAPFYWAAFVVSGDWR